MVFAVEILLILFIWFVAGFVNGLSGMGASMIAVPFLVYFLDVQVIIPLACLVAASLCFIMTMRYYKNINYKSVFILTVTSIPGSFLGSYLLEFCPAIYLKGFMSFILITYSFWSIKNKTSSNYIQHNPSLPFSSAIGFASGLSGGSISFGGPPLAVFVLYTGWDKEEVLSTLSLVGGTILTFACISHAMRGLYTPETLHYASISLLGGIGGFFLALPFTKRISQVTFRKIILIIIAISGVLCSFQVFLELFSKTA